MRVASSNFTSNPKNHVISYSEQISESTGVDLSDISQGFEIDDIFTLQDVPCAGLHDNASLIRIFLYRKIARFSVFSN